MTTMIGDDDAVRCGSVHDAPLPVLSARWAPAAGHAPAALRFSGCRPAVHPGSAMTEGPITTGYEPRATPQAAIRDKSDFDRRAANTVDRYAHPGVHFDPLSSKPSSAHRPGCRTCRKNKRLASPRATPEPLVT